MKSTIFLSTFLLLLTTCAYAGANTGNIYKPWSKYGDNISTCTPEQFILPEPDYSNLSADERKGLRESKELQVYKIHGWEDKKCVVSNKDNPVPGKITTGIQYCNFPKEDLDMVSTFAREIAINGKSKTLEQSYVNVLKKDCMMVY